MTTKTASHPARVALALTAASALAGGAWVAEHRPAPSHYRVLGLPGPRHAHVSVAPTSYAVTGTTSVSVAGYSRTNSATPAV